MKVRFAKAFALLLLSFVFFSCAHEQETSSNTQQESPSESQHTVRFRYAKGLSVEFFPEYSVVSLFRTTREVKDTMQVVLLKKGAQKPMEFDKAPIIETPIRGIIPLSTTFLEPLYRLGVLEKILAVENNNYITQDSIKTFLNTKNIPEVGSGEQLDQEIILGLAPDLMMTSGFESEKSLQKLKELGIPVVPNLDWQENTPLGRVEWIKYMALFFGKEQEAAQLFDAIEKQYLEVAQKVKTTTTRPKVLVEIPFKGTWYVAGGNSFTANLLKDAGADYPWANDTTTGSIPLELEQVYAIGLEADFWINTSTAKQKKDILAVDSRFDAFKAFKTNQLYNNNRRLNAQGGNDFWNTGVLNPHLVLSDLVKIFHPEILPEYEFTYYRQITD